MDENKYKCGESMKAEEYKRFLWECGNDIGDVVKVFGDKKIVFFFKIKICRFVLLFLEKFAWNFLKFWVSSYVVT